MILSEKQKSDRVKHALTAFDRKNVMFPDEYKITLYWSDHRRTYSKKNSRNLRNYKNKRQVGGGDVMSWNILPPNELLSVERVSSRVNSMEYKSMLS